MEGKKNKRHSLILCHIYAENKNCLICASFIHIFVLIVQLTKLKKNKELNS
jgi:hypothetical protein